MMECANPPATPGQKLAITVFGLCFGLLLAEAGLWGYDRWLQDAPYRIAPKYQPDPARIHLAVFGGSTSAGWPYCSLGVEYPKGTPFNLLSPLAFFLRERCGQTNVVVDSYAQRSWPLERSVEHYWKTARWKPDVMVVYAGHNETSGYYSPNMKPPPAVLAPLRFCRVGRKVLHALYVRQVDVADKEYRGGFFTQQPMPAFEREIRSERYERQVQRLIRHCRQEHIALILVAPEGNLLYPPHWSEYRGPRDRKEDAVRLFKQAFRAKYLEGDPKTAEARLREILGFCEFSQADYELGELCYRNARFAEANALLRRSRDLDGFPISILSEHRAILLRLARENNVPLVDMQELLRTFRNAEVPDNRCFIDNCHLPPDVYEELARRLLVVMMRERIFCFELPAAPLKVTAKEWVSAFGLTTQAQALVHLTQAQWYRDDARFSWIRWVRLEQGLEQARLAVAVGLPESRRAEGVALVSQLELQLAGEKVRMQAWVSE